MKKRVTAVLLSFVLAAGLLAGCGGSSAGSAAEPASAAEETSSGDKTQIEFWYAGGKTAVGVIEGIVKEFNESQDKYEVTTVTQGNYNETYQALLRMLQN